MDNHEEGQATKKGCLPVICCGLIFFGGLCVSTEGHWEDNVLVKNLGGMVAFGALIIGLLLLLKAKWPPSLALRFLVALFVLLGCAVMFPGIYRSMAMVHEERAILVLRSVVSAAGLPEHSPFQTGKVTTEPSGQKRYCFEKGEYRFTLVVSPQQSSSAQRYVCVAQYTRDSELPSFYVDESGVIREAFDGKVPSASSPPIRQQIKNSS